MSNRIDLSAHTWIENRRLYSRSEEVVAGWKNLPGFVKWKETVSWSIFLTAVAPVYEYREGEPFVAPARGTNALFCSIESTSYGSYDKMHRRAAIVCDTAEQFRALHAALKEARGG